MIGTLKNGEQSLSMFFNNLGVRVYQKIQYRQSCHCWELVDEPNADDKRLLIEIKNHNNNL